MVKPIVEHFARACPHRRATSASSSLMRSPFGLEPGAGGGCEGADLAFDLVGGLRQSIRASALSILAA